MFNVKEWLKKRKVIRLCNNIEDNNKFILPTIPNDLLNKVSTNITENVVPIVMFNDDKTSMDFVVMVLKKYFQHDCLEAARLMIQVHTKGDAEVFITSYTNAVELKRFVNEVSEINNFPLKCIVKNV